MGLTEYMLRENQLIYIYIYIYRDFRITQIDFSSLDHNVPADAVYDHTWKFVTFSKLQNLWIEFLSTIFCLL